MKTSKKIFVGAAVIALALVSVSMVSADTTAFGPGNGGFGRGIGEDDGLLDEYMQAVIADKLELTVEELEAYEAQGISHYDIAMDQGMTVEAFNTILEDAREEAIALAAADGITIQAFGMNADGLGQFGGGMRVDGDQMFGLRAEDGTQMGYGNRMMTADGCDEETCVAQPAGVGMGRGGRW